jgi:hypothetical protein
LAQKIFWSPLRDPAVLLFAQRPDILPPEPAPSFGETDLGGDTPEGRYAFYGAASSQYLILSDTAPHGALAALIPLDADTFGRIEALSRFWRACEGRSLPPDTRMTADQRRRLRLKLQAVDGRMNGASYREIAIAIYGEGRVAAGPWKTSPLRDTVIGLVEGGFAMIGGGYLQLLRHRRRS